MSDSIAISALRRAICSEELCIDHGTGTVGCPVPREPGAIIQQLANTVGRDTPTVELFAELDPDDSRHCPRCDQQCASRHGLVAHWGHQHKEHPRPFDTSLSESHRESIAWESAHSRSDR